MKNKPNISNAEWQVMRLLWKKSPRTVKEMVTVLTEETSWQTETVRTLINRLAKKKAIGFAKKGRSYQYFALISEEDCVKANAKSIIERAGAAILKPVLTTLIEKEQLSDAQIEEIQSILDKKAKKK